MDIEGFLKEFNRLKDVKPILFGLDSDCVVDDFEIEACEDFYVFSFPDSYKGLLKSVGGGHIGYTCMYSLDKTSSFNLMKHVTPEMVRRLGMIPVIDLEDGDLLGFGVSNNVCTEEIYFYSHDDQSIRKVYDNLFDAVIEIGFRNNLGGLG